MLKDCEMILSGKRFFFFFGDMKLFMTYLIVDWTGEFVRERVLCVQTSYVCQAMFKKENVI